MPLDACTHCQNYDISFRPRSGYPVSEAQLAYIISDLYTSGARNINWVGGEPTPNLYTILGALILSDISIAQIWNSNFYHSKEVMSLLLDVIDLWLPDFKYGSDECAKRLSNVDNYLSVVTRNIKDAYLNTVEGLSSIIIRHLVLPNHYECCSKPILEWIASETPKAPVNIMAQYRPYYLALTDKRYSDVSRAVYREEVNKVRKLADELGVEWRSVTY
ncbi:MAG: hypothetical protein OdinLCB4_004700 [Candidatus Odinarchaeum yellowstonii]|uniref:Radical SAM protein n=1 Tax=Odinarchaeota yellowstonii (strain LCB_4) TaxID=1841599 RepID=A0AAF0D180_ODILC|nr:MAG: hypothetical protein OdinLCB4_004700 [Candidatus Odinarchaeum yellowstonii]